MLQQTVLDFPNANSGYICKFCGSFCKVYKKPLVCTAIADLIRLVKLYDFEDQAIHISKFTKQRSNFYTLSYWGFIEKGDVIVDEKKRSSGYWKPTSLGIDFVNDNFMAYAVAETYNNKLIKRSGERINVITALGKKFDYKKLMSE